MSRASFIVNPFVPGNTLFLQPSGEQYSYRANSKCMWEFMCSINDEKIWMLSRYFLTSNETTKSFSIETSITQ